MKQMTATPPAFFRLKFILLYFILAVQAPLALSAESEEPEEAVKKTESAFERAAAEEANKDEAEKIKVTGSRIKRIDIEGPNPVAIYTKEDIENSGYLNFSEFFENTSHSNFGSVHIHNRSTLTLVNGARLVYDNAPDFIPTSAIERVEILKDGAAALYGSDVAGGVINIITKKDLSAPAFSLKLAPTAYPLYKGGSEAEGSAVFARSFNRGKFISSWQFQYSDSLKYSQRKKWFADYFLEISPYARFLESESAIFVDPACPEDLKVIRKRDSKLIGCKHNYIPYWHIQPRVYNLSSYNYAEIKINELTFYTQWFGFFQNSKEANEPIIDDELEIPAGHKMRFGGGRPGKLTYLFEDVYSDQLNSMLYVDGQAGLKGYISKTWDFDISFKWSNLWERETFASYPYLKDLQNIILKGEYDPFDPSRRDFSNVRLHKAVYKDADSRFFASWDFSGESGLWGVDLALGAQAYYNKYREHADPLAKAGKIYALTAAETLDLPSRTLAALYAEAAKNISNRWEIQAAGRIDNYSDWIQKADQESGKKRLEINSKWTANPKLAMSFKPSENFLIRYSIGTSFELPALSSLYTAETTGYISIYDTAACYNELKAGRHFEDIYGADLGKGFDSQDKKDQLIKEFLIEQSAVAESQKVSKRGKIAFKGLAEKLGDQEYCRVQSFKGAFKGNKNLKETKALTAFLGFHWQLGEDHSLTADYWRNSLTGTPGRSLNKKAIDAELRYGKQHVEKYGVQYERDDSKPYSPIKNPVSSLINIGGKKLSGFDLKWVSSFPQLNFAGGHFYFEDSFAYVLKAGVELFPGMGYVNNLGKFGLPKWRNFASFGWKSRSHNVSLLLKSHARVKKKRNEFESLPIGHVADLFYQYEMSEKRSLKLGFYNALFLEPVIDDSIKQDAQFDRDFYSSRGPVFFAELRQSL